MGYDESKRCLGSEGEPLRFAEPGVPGKRRGNDGRMEGLCPLCAEWVALDDREIIPPHEKRGDGTSAESGR